MIHEIFRRCPAAERIAALAEQLCAGQHGDVYLRLIPLLQDPTNAHHALEVHPLPTQLKYD